MSTADRQTPGPGPTGDPAVTSAGYESGGPAESGIPESQRNLLLTFLFDLAAQHVRRYRQLDFENLSHEIGMKAFEQIWRQPAAREKICSSLRDGTEEWKRVAHMCVIHARAENVRRELLDRRRRSGISVEVLDPQTPRTSDSNEWLADLRRCVDQLDGDRQAVLRLRFERGLTFREIAEELNWNKTRVHGCYATAIIQLERSLKARV